jgi:hypothetical protein
MTNRCVSTTETHQRPRLSQRGERRAAYSPVLHELGTDYAGIDKVAEVKAGSRMLDGDCRLSSRRARPRASSARNESPAADLERNGGNRSGGTIKHPAWTEGAKARASDPSRNVLADGIRRGSPVLIGGEPKPLSPAPRRSGRRSTAGCATLVHVAMRDDVLTRAVLRIITSVYWARWSATKALDKERPPMSRVPQSHRGRERNSRQWPSKDTATRTAR